MKHLSQKDSRWSRKKLGTCAGETISRSGCVITSLAILADTTPDKVNELLIANQGYADGCIVRWNVAAKLLDLPYNSATNLVKEYPVIGETHHFKSKGVPQHFFVVLEDGRILDPLDKTGSPPKENPYEIASYRNVTRREDMFKDPTGEFGGVTLNAEKWYKSAKRYRDDLIKNQADLARATTISNDRLERLEKDLEEIEALQKKESSLKAEIGLLERATDLMSRELDSFQNASALQLILKGLKKLFRRN
jgi:hypothetical protein